MISSTTTDILSLLLVTPAKKHSANAALDRIRLCKQCGESVNATKYAFSLQGSGYISLRVFCGGASCRDFGFYLKPSLHKHMKSYCHGA